ncbi:protein NYNRIN-like [Passer domesticus]|uniref:protein NYNRIN-like n=1 Tax=Passer domesticus TaxID=48849 RepID=UPI0030FEA396
MGIGNFLLVPESDYNLLGRDMIVELGIQIEVVEQEIRIKLCPLRLEDEKKINPEVWYSPDSAGRLEITPFKVTIRNPEIPVRIKQYPMSLEGRKGLKPEIDRLISQGLLEPCMSPYNTPILPVKKPNRSYRLVHDLREINKRTIARFPVVANPYTLLSKLSPDNHWYSVIDLKDAFWACPLDEASRDYFAFEWEDPETGRKQQLRWTVLPQGFTESPNLFGQALEQILENYQTDAGVTLIQYVDDLLLAGKEEEEVRRESIRLLNFLGLKGLKVSRAKLQFVEEEVKYLGHYLRRGEKRIDPERVQAILSLPIPKNKRQIRQILGLTGYCRQWIENYSSKARFLYQKLTQDGLMKWTQEDTENLKELKESLVHAPVLSLPDLKRSFYLFVNIEGGVAFGVLTQEWADKKKPVAYLSKLLDPVSRGWPTCLQILAGCALLVEEAKKITFNSSLKVYSPHNIRSVMQQKADKWISDARLLKYEGILLEAPNFTLETTAIQNPATFLFGSIEQEPLTHNCLITIEEQTKIRPDLEEEELDKGERLFVDGSSRVIEGKRQSGYAIIGGKGLQVVESGALDKSWSAQACELYAILRALKLLKGKEGTIYTDSKYGFGVVHTFGKLWEERGLINSQGKGLVHQQLIAGVLQALRGPKRIAVVHLKGHQTGTDLKTRGNNAADQEAKRAAAREMVLRENSGEQDRQRANTELVFTPEEEDKLKKLELSKNNGKWITQDGREILPKAVAQRILYKLHQSTHWGAQGLADHFATKYMTIGLHDIAKYITKSCPTCLRVNRSNLRKLPPGGRPLAKRPFSNIQIDFTELPKVGRIRYLLVIVDHLTHYVEAFPTTRETAQTVVKTLLEEIVPRYGVPETIDSDKGPHFTSKVTQDLANALGIKWEQHTPYHPQSSGRVERMNGEIKKQLTKLVLETKLSWVKCIPLSLLNVRTQPRADMGLSPFEMLYGMPYNLEKVQSNPNISDQNLNHYLTILAKYRKSLWEKGMWAQRPPLNLVLHQVQPGDWVLIKSWKENPLTPKWEGPYLTLLTTDTAVRTAERGWTHASRIKGPVNPSNFPEHPQNPQWRIKGPPDGLKLTLTKTPEMGHHPDD